MTVDVKYFFCNNKNLPQPTGMQLSKKYVTFSKFFARFRNLHLISNFLKKKKDDSHSLCISEITDSKECG